MEISEKTLSDKILRDSYLLWIKRQRDQYASSTFGCNWERGRTIGDYIFGSCDDITYYDIMESIVRNPSCSDWAVRDFWERDKRYLRTIQGLSSFPKINGNKFFITITTDRHRATSSKLLKFVYQLRDKTKWIKSLRGVIENFRENGEILHTHLIIEVYDDNMYGSAVKDKLWSLKALKELIGGSNYIDYLKYDERHDKYISGDKRPEKMEFVMKDREWREKNNIPHLIEKIGT